MQRISPRGIRCSDDRMPRFGFKELFLCVTLIAIGVALLRLASRSQPVYDNHCYPLVRPIGYNSGHDTLQHHQIVSISIVPRCGNLCSAQQYILALDSLDSRCNCAGIARG